MGLPAMEKENRSINLLGDKGKSTSDILLLWALYIGRLLVILTETLALIVFLSRFSIDRKLIDYSDSIKKQQALVEFFKEGEEAYRKAQLKLSISKINIASSSATVNFFDELMRKSNNEITFSSLSVTPTTLSVTAQASTADILAVFTNQLKEHPLVTTVSVDKVESKPKSALISITLSAQLKRKIK